MVWQAFVVEHGWRARRDHLAHVLGVPSADIDRLRNSAPRGCRRLPKALDFGELFARWHGRPPADEEWPSPRRSGSHGAYEWLAPEFALLARVVGTLSVPEIAEALTRRLRALTGDPAAERNRVSVQIQANRIGLQTGTDLTGGLTTREAAARVGRVSLVNQAIQGGHLRTIRIGKRHVIPREEFDRWFSAREQPPAGWVRLASLREPLGIGSDSKLPEYAKLGHIPDVVLVHVGGSRGTWFIDPDRARQMLEDAKAGRPLPWYGKPLPGNQRAMWAKWQQRKHRRCVRCAAIWQGQAPTTFQAFCARYGELTIGDKRHLTLEIGKRKAKSSRAYGTCWSHRSSGITVYQAARRLHQPSRWIRAWIRRGLFQWGGLVRDAVGGEAVRITPVGLSILEVVAADEAAKRAAGGWLGVHRAAHHVGVSVGTLYKWRDANLVTTRPGSRGLLYDQESLERQARRYWDWAVRRFKRAQPPAWVRTEAA